MRFAEWLAGPEEAWDGTDALERMARVQHMLRQVKGEGRVAEVWTPRPGIAIVWLCAILAFGLVQIALWRGPLGDILATEGGEHNLLLPLSLLGTVALIGFGMKQVMNVTQSQTCHVGVSPGYGVVIVPQGWSARDPGGRGYTRDPQRQREAMTSEDLLEPAPEPAKADRPRALWPEVPLHIPIKEISEVSFVGGVYRPRTSSIRLQLVGGMVVLLDFDRSGKAEVPGAVNDWVVQAIADAKAEDEKVGGEKPRSAPGG